MNRERVKYSLGNLDTEIPKILYMSISFREKSVRGVYNA